MSLSIIITYESNHGMMCQGMHVCIIITIIIIIIISMWNVKTKAIPVIIGATGAISKTFRKYVSNIPGNHAVK